MGQKLPLQIHASIYPAGSPSPLVQQKIHRKPLAVNTKKKETKKTIKIMSVLCKSRTLLDVCPGDGEDGCRAVGGGRHHAEWLGAPAHDGRAARGHHRVRGQEGGQVRLYSCKGGLIIRVVNEKFSQYSEKTATYTHLLLKVPTIAFTSIFHRIL